LFWTHKANHFAAEYPDRAGLKPNPILIRFADGQNVAQAGLKGRLSEMAT
jgi:hypothetical protein